jgi:hypothetical protein
MHDCERSSAEVMRNEKISRSGQLRMPTVLQTRCMICDAQSLLITDNNKEAK